MESFVHLRKGTTPRRMHADLNGLKDDELGRGGFTGRTASMYRRHDPTRFRAVGPLRPVDVLADQLKPADATDASGAPMLLFSNSDCRISLSRRSEAMPFHVRYIDGDLLCFVHQGSGRLETEFGPLNYRTGDWIYLPKACTWRQVPNKSSESTWLMIEATDDFRAPPPGPLGRHWPFDPSLATIPEPEPVDDDERTEYEVRLMHRGVDGVLTRHRHAGDLVAVVRGHHGLLADRRQHVVPRQRDEGNPPGNIDSRHARRLPWSAWLPCCPTTSRPTPCARSARGSTRPGARPSPRPPP